jgi:coproporphyrinogen III oxidase
MISESDRIEGNKEMRIKMEKMLREAQIFITQAISDIDGGATFREDCWTRGNGGGGMSRVLCGGNVFEKAGVNLSVVYGTMPQEALLAATERGVDRAKGMAPGERVPFFACGLSSVMHPKNPFCPTMHFNYRYFETDGGVWWFGGGTDITPSFIDEDDMKHVHGTYKEVCDCHDPNYYTEFKSWADRYFFLPHRGETRGLGGIFFDDQNDRDPVVR